MFYDKGREECSWLSKGLQEGWFQEVEEMWRRFKWGLQEDGELRVNCKGRRAVEGMVDGG